MNKKTKTAKEIEFEIWRLDAKVSSHDRTVRDRAVVKRAALRAELSALREKVAQ